MSCWKRTTAKGSNQRICSWLGLQMIFVIWVNKEFHEQRRSTEKTLNTKPKKGETFPLHVVGNMAARDIAFIDMVGLVDSVI